MESDLKSHERFYDLMTDNGQIRKVIGDSLAIDWDTPKAIQKITPINESISRSSCCCCQRGLEQAQSRSTSTSMGLV